VTTPSLPARVVRTIREHNLLKPDDTVIVALSGGADSCALLDLLANLPGFPLNLVAVHLNHCLRRSESDDDEEFCRTLAERYGILFESRRLDVAALAAGQRQNLEECGRQARIDFLTELRSTYRANAVALGHHADDQAETFLMRLLRGSGMTGLAGMPCINNYGHIRPLLHVSRSEIIAYLNQRGLSWREDASNRDTAFLRNRVRHELLPLLEQYNPAIKERLVATSAILHEDNELLESLTAHEYEKMVQRESDSVAFDVTALQQLHSALLKRIIRHAVSDIVGTLRNLSSRHVSDVEALLSDGAPNRTLDLPGNMAVHREYERLRFCCDKSKAETSDPIYVHGPGRHALWDGMILDVSLVQQPVQPDHARSDTGFFDLCKIPFPWCIRRFTPGDRMLLPGITGSKKVKDIFIDLKVPRTVRSRIPLVFSNGELAWICGVRFSANAAISNNSSPTAQAVLLQSTAHE
jgi:tRNA(Ile)-lysidine synthase